MEFRFDELDKVIVSGNMEGYDFTLPMSFEQAQIMLEQIKNSAENTKNRVSSLKRTAKKTQEFKKKSDKKEAEPSSGGGGPDNQHVFAKMASVSTKASVPPPLPPFREPATPVSMVRQRMNQKDKDLLAKFERCMPKVPKGKRRSSETMKKLEIARSYILANQQDTILDWIKHLKEKENKLALASNS